MTTILPMPGLTLVRRVSEPTQVGRFVVPDTVREDRKPGPWSFYEAEVIAVGKPKLRRDTWKDLATGKQRERVVYVACDAVPGDHVVCAWVQHEVEDRDTSDTLYLVKHDDVLAICEPGTLQPLVLREQSRATGDKHGKHAHRPRPLTSGHDLDPDAPAPERVVEAVIP